MADNIDTALGIADDSSAEGRERSEETPSEFVERIRSQTCYSALRGFIVFVAVISIIVLLISVLVCLVQASREENGLFLLIGIGGGILGVISVIAWQQASSLLIDIADTLVEQNRRKNPHPASSEVVQENRDATHQ